MNRMGEKANYLVGAIVANSPAWIVSALLPQNISDWWISTITVYLIVSVLGGALGGYLIARSIIKPSPLRLGIVCGALSYGILAIVDAILRVEPMIDSVALIGFTVGFAIGARIIELKRLGRR